MPLKVSYKLLSKIYLVVQILLCLEMTTNYLFLVQIKKAY